MELNHINVRLRNLPKECEEEPEETITSEVGDLEDDDILKPQEERLIYVTNRTDTSTVSAQPKARSARNRGYSYVSC